MKFIISDKEEVQQAIKEILSEPYQKNAEQWAKQIEDTNSVSAKEYKETLKQLFALVKEQQECGKKDALTFINIHYLRSSLLDESFQLVLDAYSSRYYFDNVDTEVSWCPTTLKHYYETDIQYLEERIRKMNIIISPQELQVVKQKHYFDYLVFLPGFCQIHFQNMMKTELFGQIKTNEDFIVQYGEYMGPMIPIHAQFSQERIDEILHDTTE